MCYESDHFTEPRDEDHQEYLESTYAELMHDMEKEEDHGAE